jgi:hypothetical protein
MRGDHRSRMLRGEGRSAAICKRAAADRRPRSGIFAACDCQAIWKSSRVLPPLISAPSHSGTRPRPDQTSSGLLGLRYFAATLCFLTSPPRWPRPLPLSFRSSESCDCNSCRRSAGPRQARRNRPHLGLLPGWAPLLLPEGLALAGAGAFPVVAGPRELTSVIDVMESGLMTIITGLRSCPSRGPKMTPA